jgi:hypothetical protein
MGAEIFHSRSNRPPLANSSVKKEDPIPVKRLGAVNSFNSTPSVIGRAIQPNAKKAHPLATQLSPQAGLGFNEP